MSMRAMSPLLLPHTSTRQATAVSSRSAGRAGHGRDSTRVRHREPHGQGEVAHEDPALLWDLQQEGAEVTCPEEDKGL